MVQAIQISITPVRRFYEFIPVFYFTVTFCPFTT